MKPILSALRGLVCDPMPVWLMRQAGRYLPEYRKVRAQSPSFLDLCFTPRLAAEVTLQPLRRYAVDAAIIFSDILVIPHALGQSVRFETGEGPRLDPIRSSAQITALQTDQIASRLSPVYEAISIVHDVLDDATALIGFSGAPWTLACYSVDGHSANEFAATRHWAYQDPDGLSALIDRLTTAVIDHLSLQISAGVDVLQLFDSWAGLVPPTHFERFVIAPTRAIITAIHSRHPGVPVIGFPRNIGLNLHRYATETGVDAISLDTTVPLAAARSFAIPVQGNLDPLALRIGGDTLKREATAILEAFCGIPAIFNLGHGVLPTTPPEHVADLIHCIRAKTA